MLQKIRENSQGWIAWTIVALIVVTFALFGIEQYAQSERTIIVAEVNGKDITGTEFLILYHRQKQRLHSQLGDLYDQIVQDEVLRTKVLDSLIESRVIQQWASDNDVVVSDEQLSATIESSAIFHKDGKFDKETYSLILSNNGLSVARYEYEQRMFLIENQYKELSSSSAIATQTQVKQLAKLQQQERNFNYLRIDHNPLAKKIKITKDKVADFYDKNKQNFITSKKVKVDYLLLSQQDIAKKIVVNEDDLKNYYQDNQDQFTSVEQREASHILVKVDNTGKDVEALQKIIEIQNKIKAGEDFAKLARKNSDDPGSANLGGDLGKFKQGIMVAEFDESVFSLEEGQISEPIKTDFGYHLIKLNKIYPKYIKAYKDVKNEVENSFREKEAEKQYFNLLDKLNTLTYEHPDTLEIAADELGIKVKTSTAFSKDGGEGVLASNSKVVVAAFSEEVMKNKINSSTIELSDISSVVIRINQIIVEKQQELAEVSMNIAAEIKKQAGIKASADLAKDILAKLNSGAKLEFFAKEGLEYQAKGWVNRQDSEVLPQIIEVLFKTPRPVGDKSTFTSAVYPTGDSVLIEVISVKDGSITLSKEEAEQLKMSVESTHSESEYNARISAIFESAEIDRKESYKTLK